LELRSCLLLCISNWNHVAGSPVFEDGLNPSFQSTPIMPRLDQVFPIPKDAQSQIWKDDFDFSQASAGSLKASADTRLGNSCAGAEQLLRIAYWLDLQMLNFSSNLEGPLKLGCIRLWLAVYCSCPESFNLLYFALLIAVESRHHRPNLLLEGFTIQLHRGQSCIWLLHCSDALMERYVEHDSIRAHRNYYLRLTSVDFGTYIALPFSRGFHGTSQLAASRKISPLK